MNLSKLYFPDSLNFKYNLSYSINKFNLSSLFSFIPTIFNINE